MRDEGFVHAVTAGLRPGYPPLDSILLWFGIGDPLFEGRLLPWLLLVLFAVFFRARLARTAPGLAPAGLLFLVATVHVWQGVATYYADVPLMVFAAAGSFLVLGFPAATGAAPSRFDRVAGALCLAAAVLVRPDGLLRRRVLAALGRAGALAGRRRALSFAAAAWATWARAARRAGAEASVPWERLARGAARPWGRRSSDPVPCGPVASTGVGTAVYRRPRRAPVPAGARPRPAGRRRARRRVTFLSLGAVAGLYAVPVRGGHACERRSDTFRTWAAATGTSRTSGWGG